MISTNDPRRYDRRIFQTVAGGFAAWLVLGAGNASAFNPIGATWPQPSLTVYAGIPSSPSWNGTQTDWAAALTEAADQWTDMTDFDFTVVNQYSDPCDTSAQGQADVGVDFAPNLCSGPFTEALASTILYIQGDQIVRGDIVFDSNLNWSVYTGPHLLFNTGTGILEINDFRRIALHELGHLLGLDHSTEASIMNVGPNHLNQEDVTADDIAGVASIYSGAGGGTTGCTVDTDCPSGLVCNAGECIQPDDHGDTMGEATELSPTDIPLAAFLSDANDVDYFQFGVTDDGAGRILTISTSGTTDTVGMLYDGSGTLLASNSDGSATDVNFSIVQAIDSGGTFYIAVSSDASGPGPYTLNLSVSQLCATNSAIGEDDAACVADGTTGGGTTDGGGGGGGSATGLLTLVLLVGLALFRRRAV